MDTNKRCKLKTNWVKNEEASLSRVTSLFVFWKLILIDYLTIINNMISRFYLIKSMFYQDLSKVLYKKAEWDLTRDTPIY